VTDVEEAARLYAALISGETFDRQETLDLMLAAPGHPAGSPYRIGLFGDGTGRAAVYRHGGFWGLHAAIVPARGLAVVGVGLDRAMTPAVTRLVEGLAARG
jgi:CubicO group peptidase (beta-lactamase class C family)